MLDSFEKEAVEKKIVLPKKESMERVTVYNKRLELFKNLHAWVLLYLPVVALLLGIALSFYRPVMFETILVAGALYFLMILGGSVGFHRLIAHRCFKTSRFMKYFLLILGSMNAQGSLIYWVSNHRRHHQNSDSDGDPHSPHIKDGKRVGSKWQGFVHAQVTWTYTHKLTSSTHYAKDLMRDSDLRFINAHYFNWVLLGLLIPGLLVALISQSAYGLIEGVIWGGLVRILFTTHATNSINSLCHLIGHRSYDTNDLSTNIAWLSLVTVGESWHNNHHAYPVSARFGLKWWQLDLGYYFIVLLQKAGLVWDVRTPDTLKGKRNG